MKFMSYFQNLGFNICALCYRCLNTPLQKDCPEDIRKMLASDEYCGGLNRNNPNSPFLACYGKMKDATMTLDNAYEDCITDICLDFESKNPEKFNNVRCMAMQSIDMVCDEEKMENWEEKYNCGKYMDHFWTINMC